MIRLLLPSICLLYAMLVTGCDQTGNRQPAGRPGGADDAQGNAEPGFKDVVKNPEYWDAFHEAHRELESAVEEAKKWDDEKVAKVVRRYILEVSSSRDAAREARILRELGERTHSAVLAILTDRALHDRLVEPSGKGVLPEAPFNRACELLGHAPPPEAVAAVAPFLECPSDEIRKDAALVIGKSGGASIVPWIRKAFEDPDEYVRSYALMGLEFALDRGGLADNCAAELFPDVLRLLEEGKNADRAAGILLHFDRERATDYFLSPSVFSADSAIVHDVLRALVVAEVVVPRGKLLVLVEALESGDLEYPREYALAAALRLLGQYRLPEDRELLRAHMSHTDERVAEGAADGLLRSHGLEGFEDRLWEAEAKLGYDGLNRHQRYYLAVFMCHGEINNGGLAQYFVNSSGDLWRDALAGFEAMGSTERLGVLRDAVARFGEQGPSEDRSERQQQLAELYRSNDRIFAELDSRYYDSSEVLDVLAARFVLANPDRFR